VLASRRYPRLVLAAVLATLVFATGVTADAAASAASARTRQAAKKKHKLSRAERNRIRKQLARQLRRNPASALSPAFLRKAAQVEFQLPLTVRLSASDGQGGFKPSDDQLEIDWDDSAFTWPLADGIMPANETVSIGGSFSADAVFGGGDTTGYGELGATETLFGKTISMSSDPFTISEFATACPSGPQLTTDPNSRVTITSSDARYGIINLFSGELRGTLSLEMTFASNLATSCGATPALTPVVDNTTAPPMPVRFDGKFSISPAITPDGKMRFGKITVDDSVTPQLTTFAFVRSCTDTATCAPEQFPARLKFKKLTAEVLLGNVFH
jgi:hypothetical protein